MLFVLWVLMAYLLGAIPFGFLLTKYAAGFDVRRTGSGNIGATNVLRSGHKKLAAGTLLLDGLKGTLLILGYRGIDPAPTWKGELILSAVAIIGHLYPIFLSFRGGKGVATALGCLFVLEPWVGACASILWLLAFFLTRKSAVAALTALLLLPFYAYALSGIPLMIWSLLVGSLIVYKHKENILRLYHGTEPKIASSSRKNP